MYVASSSRFCNARRSHLTCMLPHHGIEFGIGGKVIGIGLLQCLPYLADLPGFKLNVLPQGFAREPGTWSDESPPPVCRVDLSFRPERARSGSWFPFATSCVILYTSEYYHCNKCLVEQAYRLHLRISSLT
jgi:hypothetical protein